jgi:lysophospholipase L1-like esterase
MKIVLFGDSYTAGRVAGTSNDGALSEALGVPCDLSLAVSGSTAVEWVLDQARLDAVCNSTADVAVGSLGGNDLFKALQDGVVTFAEKVGIVLALLHVVNTIAKSIPHVVIMVYPDPFSGTRADAKEAQWQIANTFHQLPFLNNVHLLFLSGFLSKDHFDGVDIHPTKEGYAVMASAITDIINKKGDTQ